MSSKRDRESPHGGARPKEDRWRRQETDHEVERRYREARTLNGGTDNWTWSTHPPAGNILTMLISVLTS